MCKLEAVSFRLHGLNVEFFEVGSSQILFRIVVIFHFFMLRCFSWQVTWIEAPRLFNALQRVLKSGCFIRKQKMRIFFRKSNFPFIYHEGFIPNPPSPKRDPRLSFSSIESTWSMTLFETNIWWCVSRIFESVASPCYFLSFETLAVIECD